MTLFNIVLFLYRFRTCCANMDRMHDQVCYDVYSLLAWMNGLSKMLDLSPSTLGCEQQLVGNERNSLCRTTRRNEIRKWLTMIKLPVNLFFCCMLCCKKIFWLLIDSVLCVLTVYYDSLLTVHDCVTSILSTCNLKNFEPVGRKRLNKKKLLCR